MQTDAIINDAVHSFMGALRRVVLDKSTDGFSPNELQFRECVRSKFDELKHYTERQRGKLVLLDQLKLDQKDLSKFLTFFRFNESKNPKDRLNYEKMEAFHKLLDKKSVLYQPELAAIFQSTSSEVENGYASLLPRKELNKEQKNA
jgi:hypothetical protein